MVIVLLPLLLFISLYVYYKYIMLECSLYSEHVSLLSTIYGSDSSGDETL